jgi:DNA integrity scanning protein DisA with diadenylate cyclase activity
MFSKILYKIIEILTPIIATLIFILIVAAIYCAIFKISYKKIITNIFFPFIGLLLSLFEILWMILQFPYYVYLKIKIIFEGIGNILSSIINIFNGATNFLYDTSDNLF